MENLHQYLQNPSLEVLQKAGESDQRKGVPAPPIEKPFTAPSPFHSLDGVRALF